MSNVGVGVAGCPSLFGIHPHLHPTYDHYIIHQTNSVCCASHRAANHAQDTTLYKTEKFIVLLLIPTIKHTPKFISNIQYFFVPNIGHFLFRTSVTLCSEHPVGFRSERRSFFIPNIRHLMFRTSCIFSFRTSRRFSFRTSGKLILCFISDFEHPVI